MKIRQFLIHNFLFLTLIIFTWWAVKPIFAPGFFPIHDQPQVERVLEMVTALKAGQFPVRWVGDLGYGFGYPIFNFYAPLAYYVGALFNLLGLDVLLATKMMMAFGVVLAGASMYFLAKEFWGKWGGLVAGLFYIYAPYHAADIYVRGAVGEYWAMAFLPLVFLGLYRIFCEQRRGVLLAGLSFAAVILSHNLTAMMLMPFMVITAILILMFSKNRRLAICYLLVVTLLALSISAFYWLPALAEMKHTKVFGQVGGGADFRDHFVYLDQLWTSLWGFGGSAPGRLDGMSFIIGKWHLLGVFLALIVTIKKKSLAILTAFVFFLLAVFLTTQYSMIFWQSIPVMAFIQYPWRFLVFVVFFASLMAGNVIGVFKKRRTQSVAAVLLIAGLFIFNLKYFRPKTIFSITAADYLNERNIKWTTSKISDEYLPKNFSVPTQESEVAWNKITILSGKIVIDNLQVKSQSLSFTTNSEEDGQLRINIAYFPGWKVWIDGQPTEPEIEAGRIRLTLFPGQHQIFLKFTNTPIRFYANLISLVSVVILGALVWLKCGKIGSWW